MKKTILLLVSMAISNLALGSDKYEEIPEKFIGHIQEKDFKKAVESLYPHQDKSYFNTPDGALVINKLKSDMEDYGNYKYHERISEEKIGTRYAIVTYIVGMQFRPAYMSFKLYKPEDKWLVMSYRYNHNLKTLKKQNMEDSE